MRVLRHKFVGLFDRESVVNTSFVTKHNLNVFQPLQIKQFPQKQSTVAKMPLNLKRNVRQLVWDLPTPPNPPTPLLPRDIPDNVTRVIFYDVVGSILADAFPPTVKYIDLSRFQGGVQPGALPEGLERLHIGDVNPLLAGVIPESVLTLTLGHSFDQQFKLPSNLEEFNMGHQFDQPIELPHSLKRLRMGDSFNQQIELPDGLQELTIGRSFKQPIELPDSLDRLIIEGRYDQRIELPRGLRHLVVRGIFPHDIAYSPDLQSVTVTDQIPSGLPDDLDTLIISNVYTIDSARLPKGLKRLQINSVFKGVIPKLPYGLRTLIIQGNPEEITPGTLPDSLRELNLGQNYMACLKNGVLPDNLEKLTLSSSLSSHYKGLVVPRGLRCLAIPKGMYEIPQQLLREGLDTLIIPAESDMTQIDGAILPRSMKQIYKPPTVDLLGRPDILLL